MNPREHGELISDVLGVEDEGRTAEAFTRFFHRGARGGWNSLTYDDFAPLDDAIADAYGRPRRKRQNRAVWKLKFWWHWHVTSPLDDAVRWLGWHVLPRACRFAVHVGGTSYAFQKISWLAVQRRAHWAARHHPEAKFEPILHGLHFLEMPDAAAGDDYRSKYRITTPVEN